jgi:hypothetical protein
MRSGSFFGDIFSPILFRKCCAGPLAARSGENILDTASSGLFSTPCTSPINSMHVLARATRAMLGRGEVPMFRKHENKVCPGSLKMGRRQKNR